MKVAFIVLGFCSCAYIALGFLGKWMSAPSTDELPMALTAFGAFAICCSLCCFLAIFRAIPAAAFSWISAIAYCSISWKFNPPWIFRADVFAYSVWPPVFLTIAAYAEKRKMASARPLT
jgi:hypothetical protein